MALTLRDVAKLAGVSTTTVSRVLNGRNEVRDDVRQHVLQVIKTSGYRPLASARSLASQRLGVIGLVIPMQVATLFQDAYFGKLLGGVSQSATNVDLTLALFFFDDKTEENALVERVIGPRLVDGLVVSVLENDDDSLESVRDTGFPIVTLNTNRYRDSFSSVSVAEVEGSHEAVNYLLQTGCRRIAHVAGPSETFWGMNRLEGYRSALVDAGGVLDPRLVEVGGYSVEGGARAMDALLDAEPDAVFVASDKLGLGVMQSLERAGRRVPQDVSVLTFDGLLESVSDSPKFTAMRQPVDQVAAHAVELLLDRISGNAEKRHIEVPVELVIGETTRKLST